MKLSDIARLSVNQDSTIYNTMLGCDLISRIQQREVKTEGNYKKNKKYTSRKVKR